MTWAQRNETEYLAELAIALPHAGLIAGDKLAWATGKSTAEPLDTVEVDMLEGLDENRWPPCGSLSAGGARPQVKVALAPCHHQEPLDEALPGSLSFERKWDGFLHWILSTEHVGE